MTRIKDLELKISVIRVIGWQINLLMVTLKKTKGKFYKPIAELDIPIYLDKEIKDFFIQNMKDHNRSFSLNKTINVSIQRNLRSSNDSKDKTVS